MRELEPQEQRILEYISERITDGVPPTVREIGAALGFKSTSTVHKYLGSLQEKGYIIKHPGQKRNIRLVGDDSAARVPILGRVAAGTPILAIENIEDYVSVTTRYPARELFGLYVRGESMVEAGILDGDVIIARKTPVAENGEIVVALIDDEATVKTFYKEKGHFRLQPENASMAPILTDHVTILGKVVKVIRSYE